MQQLHSWRRTPTPGMTAALVLTALAVLSWGVSSTLSAQEPPPENRPESSHDQFGRGQEPGQSRGHGHGHGHGHGRGRGGPPPPKPVDLAAAPKITWTNPTGGNWSDAGNWSGGTVPGEKDHAIIDLPGTYTVILDAETRVTGLSLGADSGTQTVAIPKEALAFAGPLTIGPQGVLELNGGRLTGNGDLVVHGNVEWSAGSMSGRGKLRIATDGRVHLTGDERKVLSLRPLENAGKLVWSGAGNLVVTFNARIVNQKGAHFEITGGALLDVYGPPGPEVHNAGTLRVVSDLTPTFESPLVNTGTLDLEAGGLRLLDRYSGDGEVLGRARLESSEVQGEAPSAR